MPYAYQHCFGSCWNDTDHPTYRDHNLTYPTVNGSIPTLAWEGLREGVDDVRYVEALQRKILSSSAESPATVAATAYLHKLRKDITSVGSSSGRYNRLAAIDLDEVRQILVLRIKAIDSANGGQVSQ